MASIMAGSSVGGINTLPDGDAVVYEEDDDGKDTELNGVLLAVNPP